MKKFLESAHQEMKETDQSSAHYISHLVFITLFTYITLLQLNYFSNLKVV